MRARSLGPRARSAEGRGQKSAPGRHHSLARILFRALRSPLCALILALPVSGQVPDGDAHYARRHEGAEDGRAKSAPIDAAIAAYERTIAATPDDLEAHWKLLRALRFKGGFTTSGNEEKKRAYARAKSTGERALSALARRLPGVNLTKATERQVADAARRVEGAGEIFLWDSVNWGEWALAYGKLAAAREGAADRIRREATIAILIDARIEAGAPARVLGRLYEQTPRIPFVTGWASSKEAVRFLEQSLVIDPSNKLTMLFLAEALVTNDSSAKPRAVQLLQKLIAAPNHPDYLVEDAAAAADARALLAKWGR